MFDSIQNNKVFLGLYENNLHKKNKSVTVTPVILIALFIKINTFGSQKQNILHINELHPDIFNQS